MLEAIAERNGVQISVGDIETDDITPSFGASDGPQPLDVGARVVAHVMHRIPGVKKLEKRLEGKDKKSGMGSDLATLFGQLYVRNKAEIDRLAGNVVNSTIKGVVSSATPKPPAQPSVQDLFPNLGPVDPVVVNPNENGGQHA